MQQQKCKNSFWSFALTFILGSDTVIELAVGFQVLAPWRSWTVWAVYLCTVNVNHESGQCHRSHVLRTERFDWLAGWASFSDWGMCSCRLNLINCDVVSVCKESVDAVPSKEPQGRIETLGNQSQSRADTPANHSEMFESHVASSKIKLSRCWNLDSTTQSLITGSLITGSLITGPLIIGPFKIPWILMHKGKTECKFTSKYDAYRIAQLWLKESHIILFYCTIRNRQHNFKSDKFNDFIGLPK